MLAKTSNRYTARGHTQRMEPAAPDDARDEITDAINQGLPDVGDQTDEFVAAAARRRLEQTEW